MYTSSLHGNREIPGATEHVPCLVRSGKVNDRNPDMHAPREVGRGHIVSMKRTNKDVQSEGGQPSAESVERRPSAKGNPGRAAMTGTQRPEAVSNALDRVREAAKRGLATRFLCSRLRSAEQRCPRLFQHMPSFT